ncbi:hypothetical protein SLEP1_g44935 [Rubroshorea leprosula]|uniref:Uncharacterized protein n=1 Tax=Rubroshorea leprosula TaxID=152421 RepID=A0AAV5LJG7_9ROSI|nr:hypothetical protein SLEP1_g44935 [Rubroshorea leprosula]
MQSFPVEIHQDYPGTTCFGSQTGQPLTLSQDGHYSEPHLV